MTRAMRELGTSLSTWRRLRELTVAETADRAGVSTSTLQRIEHGQGGTLESVLRVGRALGMLDQILQAVDPMNSDVGRLRATESIPARVRRSRR